MASKSYPCDVWPGPRTTAGKRGSPPTMITSGAIRHRFAKKGLKTDENRASRARRAPGRATAP